MSVDQDKQPKAEVSAAVQTRATRPAAKKPWLSRWDLDPATGIGLFVPGLIVMAIGGAMTWHWIFNIGEAVMMLGMTYFVVAIAWTALQQRAERGRLTRAR